MFYYELESVLRRRLFSLSLLSPGKSEQRPEVITERSPFHRLPVHSIKPRGPIIQIQILQIRISIFYFGRFSVRECKKITTL